MSINSAKKSASANDDAGTIVDAEDLKEVKYSNINKGTMVYVGPTIVGVASTNTIFNNGLPDSILSAIEKEPAFRGLVVPIAELSEISRDLDSRKGAVYILYQKVLSYRP